MADLSTTYLGLPLKTPLLASASPLTGDLKTIERLVEYGIGGIVLPSLFEEHLTMRQTGMDFYLLTDTSVLPERLQHIPNMDGYNRGYQGYLFHLTAIKEKFDIPVIASLNGTTDGGWVNAARILEAAGADAIELNLYGVPTRIGDNSSEIEARYLRLIKAIRAQVTIPLSVKLSPFFTSIPNMAFQLEQAGADSVVLFNRFYEPEFDISSGSVEAKLELSTPDELRSRLRWTALLSGQLDLEIAVTGGVHNDEDIARSLAAGGTVAMMTSALLLNGPSYVKTVLDAFELFLDEHNFDSIKALRDWGERNFRHNYGPEIVRANYMQVMKEHPTNAIFGNK